MFEDLKFSICKPLEWGHVLQGWQKRSAYVLMDCWLVIFIWLRKETWITAWRRSRGNCVALHNYRRPRNDHLNHPCTQWLDGSVETHCLSKALTDLNQDLKRNTYIVHSVWPLGGGQKIPEKWLRFKLPSIYYFDTVQCFANSTGWCKVKRKD
jgi:hypothetical protein